MYRQTVTNEYGEILGFDYIYDGDEYGYSEYYRDDYDDEPTAEQMANHCCYTDGDHVGTEYLNDEQSISHTMGIECLFCGEIALGPFMLDIWR